MSRISTDLTNHVAENTMSSELSPKQPIEPEDVVTQMKNDQQPKVSDANGTSDDDDNAANGEGLFGNYFIRTVYIASSLLFCSMLSFGLWFSFSVIFWFEELKVGFGLSGFGAFCLIFGSIMSGVIAILTKLGRPIPFKNILTWTTIGLYVGGGLFYFIGGCAVAYGFNQLYQTMQTYGFYSSNLAFVFFGKQTFVAVHAVLAGVDLWKRDILNNKKWRILAYNAAFFGFALISFFAYAFTSMGAELGAVFYFVVMIPNVLFVVVYMVPKLKELLGKPIVYLILAGTHSLCVVCIVVISGFRDAYSVGFAFFVFLMGVAIAFDMFFDKFIPGYKDEKSSVSDQEAQNGGSALPV